MENNLNNRDMSNPNANIMTIQDLLKNKHTGFDESSKKKMYRLKSDRKDKEIVIGGEPQTMELLDIYKYHKNQFEEYLREESKHDFDNVEYVIVFLAEEGWNSRLVGVYENQGKDLTKTKQLGLNYYNFVPLSEFEKFNDRVIVDWGDNNQNPLQSWDNEKYVIRIDGYVGKNVPRFDSYENVMLSYSELKAVLDGTDAVWTKNLQSVNCVYCIVNKSTGELYIGSTYGKDGIWRRWKEYAQNDGHGGNRRLKELIEKDDVDPNVLQWIILEILPLVVKEEQAVRRENLYKEKFCTRKFGYNIYELKKK